jgi:hypothetical protein
LRGDTIVSRGILADKEGFLVKAFFILVALVLASMVGKGMDTSLYFFMVYGIILITMLVFLPLEKVFLCAVFILPIIPNYFDIKLAGSLPFINLQKITLSLISIYWVSTKILRRKKVLVGPPIVRLLLIYAFLQALSLITTIYGKASLFAYIRYWLENYLIFFMVIDLIRSKEDIIRVFNTLILSAIVVSIIGLIHYITGRYPLSFVPSSSLFDSLWMYYEWANIRLGIQRINSVFTHTIILGMFLNLVIPAALIFLISRPFQNKRMQYIAAIVILTASLILTLSRAAWMGAVVSFTIILWLWQGRQWRYMPFLPIVIACIMMFFGGDRFLPASGAIFFSSFRVIGFEPSAAFNIEGLSQLSNSTLDRGPAILAAWSKIMSRPILGYGVIGNDLTVIGYQGDIFYFLKLALDSGLLSLLVFLLFCGTLVINLYRRAKEEEDPVKNGLIVICLASVAAYLVSLQGATFPDVSYVFWIVCGIAVNLIWRRGEDDSTGGVHERD